MYREFRDLRKGQMFHLNGVDYIKQSTRTARMLVNGRVFYFGQTEGPVYPVAW